MTLHVNLLNRSHAIDLTYEYLDLSPVECEWSRHGGCRRAEIDVIATASALWRLDAILGYNVQIYNDRGDPFWWGYVHEITITSGGITTSISLDNTYNSIAGRYVTTNNEYGSVAFVEDDASVAAFGTRQRVISANNLDSAAVTQLISSILYETAFPHAVPPSISASTDLTVSARLSCRGWYETLGWIYFSRDEGREIYSPTSTQWQKLGWGVTTAKIGFETAGRWVSELDGRMRNLDKGDVLEVSGSTTNDGTYTVEQGTNQEPTSYTASTISFDNGTGNILDSANGLGDFVAHDVVYITGSASNDGYHRITQSTSDNSTLDTADGVVTESAGATITISTGNRIVVEEALVDELPGASVTIVAHGKMVAQSFTVSSGSAWTAASLSVKVRRVGNVSDNLRLAIYSDSSGAPGSEIEGANFDGASLTTSGGWVTVTLTNTTTLSLATTYWLVISRTGAQDTEAYYEIAVDEDLGASGNLRLYDDSAWVARSTNASLAYRVEGAEDTGLQMEEIVTVCGQFAAAVEAPTTNVEINQWRYGDETGLKELEALLAIGTDNSLRLTTAVTVDRIWQITEEPDRPVSADYMIGVDGILRNLQSIPLGEVYPPVGEWIELTGIVPDGAPVSEAMNPSPFMLESARYLAKSEKWSYTPRTLANPWDIRIENG